MTYPIETQHPGATGQLRDRVALVTGGARGIGEAISLRLAQEGAAVAVGYSRNEESARKFLAAATAEFPDRHITLHQGNIGVADDCRRVLREVIDQHGRLDILVNNAGITVDKTVAKMGDEDWLRVISVNLSGASQRPLKGRRNTPEKVLGESAGCTAGNRLPCATLPRSAR